MKDKKYVFGVDVGGTAIKLGLFDLKGKLIDKWQVPTDVSFGGKNILSDIAGEIQGKISEKSIHKDAVAGVGLGVPGPVNEEGTVFRCVNLGWGIFNVKEELSALLKLPVKATNDANVAALGEMWQGSGQGYDNLILITIGTGIGGGIIDRGNIIAGHKGSGGEIGHLLINKEETTPCNCGRKGCVEQYASATGIVNNARRLIREKKVSTQMPDDGTLTAKLIFDLASRGDEGAVIAVETMGDALGFALSHACCLVDPEVILIGGGVSKAGGIVTAVIEKYYRDYAFHAVTDTPFKLTQLGNDAGIYGAAKLMI